jgi:hypothetical protein
MEFWCVRDPEPARIERRCPVTPFSTLTIKIAVVSNEIIIRRSDLGLTPGIELRDRLDGGSHGSV